MSSNLTNCNFYGVKFDGDVLETMNNISNGLLQTAKGLSSLAEVFGESTIKIEALLKVVNDKENSNELSS